MGLCGEKTTFVICNKCSVTFNDYGTNQKWMVAKHVIETPWFYSKYTYNVISVTMTTKE